MGWPNVVPTCRRLKARLVSIDVETKDYTRVTSQPVRITGRAFGKRVSLTFPAMGSGTRAACPKTLPHGARPQGVRSGRVPLALRVPGRMARRIAWRAALCCLDPAVVHEDFDL